MKNKIITTISVSISLLILFLLIYFIFLKKSNDNNNLKLRYGDREGYENFCNNFDYDEIKVELRITYNNWKSKKIIKNDLNKNNIYEIWKFIKKSKEPHSQSGKIYNIQMNINFYKKKDKKDIIWVFKNFDSDTVYFYHYTIKSEIGPTVFSGHDNSNFINTITERYSGYKLDEIISNKYPY